MKKMLWILFVPLLSVAYADDPAPNLVCDQPAYAFGKRPNTETVSHTFILRNEGQTDLIISRVKPACGCTVAQLTDKTIPPGQETELKTSLNLHGRRGQQHKSILIESNDAQHPQYRLALEGEAIAEVDINPSRIYLGSVQAGPVAQRHIDLVWNGEGKFEISSVEADADFITTSMEVLKPGTMFRIAVNIDTAELEGRINQNITIRTSSKLQPVIRVPVSGIMMGPVVVTPDKIMLKNQAGAAVRRYVILRQGSAGAFQIKNVRVPDERISTRISGLGPHGYRIELNNVPMTPDLNGKELVIETDLEDPAEIRIPFVLK